MESWLTRMSVQRVMRDDCMLDEAQESLLGDPLVMETLVYIWVAKRCNPDIPISMATADWLKHIDKMEQSIHDAVKNTS